jgi:predicted dinucleotide-binding enzyme
MDSVVVGAGDIRTPLIEIATRSGNEAVVIERDTERAEEASTQYDCLLINTWVGRVEIIPVLVFLRAALHGLDP